VERTYARQFAEAERRAAQRVFAGAFFDQLSVLEKAQLKSRKFFGQPGNGARCHWVRFAYDQRFMETEGRDKVDGLELPIRENTIDDFEAERNPFDMAQNGRGIRTSGQRFFHFENDFRLDFRRDRVQEGQGCAVSGASQGKCLDRVPALKDYWFDWRNYHPDTSIYKH